jgi:hypothetical protein
MNNQNKPPINTELFYCQAGCQKRYGSSEAQLVAFIDHHESLGRTVTASACQGICGIAGESDIPEDAVVNFTARKGRNKHYAIATEKDGGVSESIIDLSSRRGY